MTHCCENGGRTGSCYFEFQRGKYEQKLWQENSIYVSAETFDEFNLKKLIRGVVPAFDYYGITEVTQDEFEEIAARAQDLPAKDVVDELTAWAERCFETEAVFTILGI